MLGSEVSLTQLVALVQGLRSDQDQLRTEQVQHRKMLVQFTQQDISHKASLVMAHIRRPEEPPRSHEELNSHFTRHRYKAQQMQAFVAKHCPGFSRSELLSHFDSVWGKRCGESLLIT